MIFFIYSYLKKCYTKSLLFSCFLFLFSIMCTQTFRATIIVAIDLHLYKKGAYETNIFMKMPDRVLKGIILYQWHFINSYLCHHRFLQRITIRKVIYDKIWRITCIYFNKKEILNSITIALKIKLFKKLFKISVEAFFSELNVYMCLDVSHLKITYTIVKKI